MQLVKQPSTELKEWFDNYQNGKFVFFNSILFDLGEQYDWTTNPDNGYKYDITKQWTEIADYSMPNVSEKMVWIILSYTDYIKRVVWSE